MPILYTKTRKFQDAGQMSDITPVDTRRLSVIHQTKDAFAMPSTTMDIGKYEYKDKTWNPSPAALSRIKMMIDAGDLEGARNLPIGYFSIGKGGTYRNDMEGNKNIRIIRLDDLEHIPTGDAGNDRFIPDLDILLKERDRLYNKYKK
jgi:hypothetical protein